MCDVKLIIGYANDVIASMNAVAGNAGGVLPGRGVRRMATGAVGRCALAAVKPHVAAAALHLVS